MTQEYFNEDEDIVLVIKKSDIKRFFKSNQNFNIEINRLFSIKQNYNNQNNSIKNRTYNCLTKREYQVLKSLAKGKSNSEIAEELVVSICTIKAHIAKILQKLNVEDRLKAVVKAKDEKII